MDKKLILMIAAAVIVFVLTVSLIWVTLFPNVASNQNGLVLTQDDENIINQISEIDLVLTQETTNPLTESEGIVPFEP